MGYQKRISSYEKIKFETADPGKLIVMLYERLERELAIAKEELVQKNYEAKGRAIVLSQDIIMELNNSLNMEAGPIASNLRSLYLYMFKELNEINLKNNGDGFAGLLEIVSDLHATWREVIDNKPATAPDAAINQKTRAANLSLVG